MAEFDFERDLAGVPREVTRFALAPEIAFLTDDRDDLDFSVIAVGPRVAGRKEIAEFGFLPLSGARNKHALGDFVNLIQHPDGRLKEAVVRENRLVSRPKSGTVLHYVADSEPGSSGSPVFNVMWDVVALHHWGGPHRELFDEHGVRVPRTVNEGVRVSAIVLDLETRKSALNPVARALVDEALMLGIERRPSPNVRVVPPAVSAPHETAPTGTAVTIRAMEPRLGAYRYQFPCALAASQGLSSLTCQQPLRFHSFRPNRKTLRRREVKYGWKLIRNSQTGAATTQAFCRRLSSPCRSYPTTSSRWPP